MGDSPNADAPLSGLNTSRLRSDTAIVVAIINVGLSA